MYIDLYSGYLISGTLFFILASRWLLVTSYLHARSSSSSNKNNAENKQQPEKPYRSTPKMSVACLPCSRIRHEWTESYLKLLGSSIGVFFYLREGILEYHAAITVPGYITPGLTWPLIYQVKHHICIYMAFLIGSILELIIHCGCVRMPRLDRLDRALLMVEFGVEAFVFSNHFCRNSIDSQLHFLLAFTVIGCLIFIIFEAFNDRQVLFTYGRIMFTFLQATWFYQIAFTLYHPAYRWNTSDSRLTANVTFHYSMHLFAIIALMLLCHWMTFTIVTKRNKKDSNEPQKSWKNIKISFQYERR